jgi:hypothetical protein
MRSGAPDVPTAKAYLAMWYCILFYIWNGVSNNDNGPVAALERPLPLLFAQRLSTNLNVEVITDVETH